MDIPLKINDSFKNLNMTYATNMENSNHETPVLGAAADLFQTLNKQGIKYCHWKSNIRLDKSLQGKTDFDLLVARKDSQAFRNILSQHNVKLLVAAPGRNYPAMENYLGFDESTGAFFHLHVHFRLVLGEQFVKNYRLPFEYDFLNSVQIRRGIKIPPPELEIVVLAVRVLLKYRTRDFIKDNIPFRGAGINTGFRTEIKWLFSQTSLEKIKTTLDNWKHVIDPNDILEFLEIVKSGKKAGLKIQRIKSRLKIRLRLFQRSNHLSSVVTYFRELWSRRKYWRTSPITKMTFPEGGQTIAIIGADGAGKSTMVALLIDWLSWKLDIYTFYLGSKKPSRRSSFYYSVFRIVRRLTSLLGKHNLLGKFLTWLRDIPLYLHHLSTGRDRYARFVEGGRLALAGSIVLFDRYPLEPFNTSSIDLYEMDGPKIASLAGTRNDIFSKWFASKEKEIYTRMNLPECVIVLDVSPDVSVARKPDHDPAVLDAKIKGVRSLIDVIRTRHQDVRIIHINADQPFDEVFLQLKRNIWSVL